MPKIFRYQDMHLGMARHFNIVEGQSSFRDFPRHTHEFIELVIVTGGMAVHEARGMRYPLKSGDVYVIHPGINHSLKEMEGLVQCHISFDPAIYLHPYAQLLSKLPGYHALFVIDRKHSSGRFSNYFRLATGKLGKLRPILDKLMESQQEDSPAKEAQTFSLFSQLAVFLCMAYQKNEVAKYPLARLARTISHIENHFTETLRLEDLAKMSHLSVSQFSRIFRDNYAASPMDYIIRRRVEHASRLMRDSDLSITQVAYLSGFNDGNYFFRQFRRIMGRGARDYRKSL